MKNKPFISLLTSLVLVLCIAPTFAVQYYVPFKIEGAPTIQMYRSRERNILTTNSPNAYNGWFLLSRAYGEWGEWTEWSLTEATSTDTQQVEVRDRESGETEYRICTRSCSYTYGKWGEWSDWVDAPVESSESRQVEARTLYISDVPITAVNVLENNQVSMLAGTGTQMVVPLEKRVVFWRSSRPDVATVDMLGFVSAQSCGETDIIARNEQGITEGIIKVQVIDDANIVPSNAGIISNEAFFGTAFEAIDLRNTKLNAIGSRAFSDCENLKLVLLDNMSGTIEDDAFHGSENISISTTNEDSAFRFAENKGIVHYLCDQPKEYVPVKAIRLNTSEMTMMIGESDTLHASILPANATSRDISWLSSNDAVEVDNFGFITAIHPGTAEVVAITMDGTVEASCNVTVQGVQATAIVLNNTNLEMKEKETTQLIARVEPESVTDPSIIWSSRNPNIASIVDGVVTANAPGTTLIDAQSNDGNKVFTSCQVTVRESVIQDDSVFSNMNADSITESDATISASVNVLSNPDLLGFYLGTDVNDLQIAAVEDTKGLGSSLVTNVNYNMKNWGRTLNANTTYYYRFYMVNDNDTIVSDIQSFKTSGAISSNTIDMSFGSRSGEICFTEWFDDYKSVKYFISDVTETQVKLEIQIGLSTDTELQSVGIFWMHNGETDHEIREMIEGLPMPWWYDDDINAYRCILYCSLYPEENEYEYYFYFTYLNNSDEIEEYGTANHTFLKSEYLEPDDPINNTSSIVRVVAVGNVDYKNFDFKQALKYQFSFSKLADLFTGGTDIEGNLVTMGCNAQRIVSAYSRASFVGSDNAKLCIDPGSVSNLHNTFLSCLKDADDNDISIIYVGGHGFVDEQNDYFTILNGFERFYNRNYNSVADLIPGIKVFIVDSCNSGALSDYFRDKQRKDVCVLTANWGNKAINARPGNEATYLVYYYLKGIGYNSLIMPADTDGDNKISFSEISSYVKTNVTNDTHDLDFGEMANSIHLQVPQYYSPEGIDPIIYQRDSWSIISQ